MSKYLVITCLSFCLAAMSIHCAKDWAEDVQQQSVSRMEGL